VRVWIATRGRHRAHREDVMIRRVTRCRYAETRKAAALERRVELWPLLIATRSAAAATTAGEPRLDAALARAVPSERNPATGPQLAKRLDGGFGKPGQRAESRLAGQARPPARARRPWRRSSHAACGVV
jgi:hypothetical protein